MRSKCLPALIGLWLSCYSGGAARADVESGPAVGSKTPALSVLGVVGDVANETVDFTARREGKPTLFVFVSAARWSRPAARLLKELDQQAAGAADGATVVAVWLTDDPAKSKEYLPVAQKSLNFSRTALCVDEKNPFGPPEWNINTTADMTVVVASGGKVAARFGFVGPNDSVAKDVLAALKAAAR